MRIVDGKDKSEIVLLDIENKEIGKGYIYEFIASEVFKRDRVNYYIHAVNEVDDINYVIRNFIVYELISRAKKLRKKYPDYDAKVYHCCFSNDNENKEYYSRIAGFKCDEGMHIITIDLNNLNYNLNHIDDSNMNYEVREDCLESDDDINRFIMEHSKVFRNSPYDLKKVYQLKKQEGFKNIGIFDNGYLIGNILLVIEEELGTKYGWIEDMFISKGYRNKGLGEYLVCKALLYFKYIGLKESRLEVWSSNERATKLYYKVGYKFLKETESSIGMMI